MLAVKTELWFLTQLPPPHPLLIPTTELTAPPGGAQLPSGLSGLEILGSSLVPTSGTTGRGRPKAAATHHSYVAMGIFGKVILLLFVINHAVY